MVFDVCMVFIAIAIVAVAVFLIYSSCRLNKLLRQTTILADTLNQNLPPVLANLQDITANTNTAVSSITEGIQQTAEGIQYLKNAQLTDAAETLIIVRRGLQLIKKLLNRRKNNE